jgi:carbon-monoxide dehydrogenase medium subunit
MYEFSYHKPASLADAAKLLAGEEAKLVAGGMTLVPTLKQRLAKPSDLIDLAAIDGLKGIKEEGGGLTIGAMTRHAEVNRSAEVKRVIPALAALAGMIGDPAVRNRGTIGGSVSNNDPAADYPAALVGLGATVVTTKREIAAERFFTGMFETALAQDEIVTAIKFPKPQAAAYQKFKNPASRYAIVGVFVARTGSGVRVAVTGAGPCVFRVPEMEAALGKSFSADAIKDIAIPDSDLNSDIHASAEYRAHLVGVMARRAVAGCGLGAQPTSVTQGER